MQNLINAFNSLNVPDMPVLQKLYGHKGSAINFEVKLPNGVVTKNFEDNKIYYTISNTLYSKEIYKASYDASEKYTAGHVHSTNINITTNETTVFDHEQNYLFYYNTVEDSNALYSYMHFVKHFAVNEEGKTFEQSIGTLDSSDVKAEEKE